MKKIITTLFFALMFIFTTAEAAENSIKISVSDGVIKITGEGEISENELISFVCVEKPENAEILDDDNLPYFIEAFNAEEGKFDVIIGIPDGMKGGKYYILAAGEKFQADGYFVYIDKSKIEDALDEINSAKSYSEIGDIISDGKIDIDTGIYNMNKDVINKILFAGIGKGYNTDRFIETLNDGYFAVLVCEGKSEEAFVYCGDEEFFKEYKELGNADGFEEAFRVSDFGKESVETSVNKALMTVKSKKAETWKELRKAILSSDDTEPTEESKEYFEFGDYNKIKNKNTVFQKMMEKIEKIRSFSELKAMFEEVSKDVYDEENKPSKGSSGGGGSSSGSSVQGGMYSPVIPNETEEEKPEDNVFSDIDNHWAKEEIYKLKNKGVINGYEDNTFKPDSFVTRAEMVKMICVTFSLYDSGEMNFSDVSDSDWHYEYVNSAYQNGIITGRADGFFPNENITREDAAVIMYRLLSKNYPVESGTISFIDKADISEYAKDAIGAMKNEGIIEGVGKNRFEPKSPITRAQCAVLINRCMLRFEITE